MWRHGITAVAMVGLIAPSFLAVATEAEAITAKARCRVRATPQVQIAVSAADLVPGAAATFTLAGAVSLRAVAGLEGDAAVEWDSAANAAGVIVGDVAEGTRGPISPTFAKVGDKVSVTVTQGLASVTASTTCVAK